VVEIWDIFYRTEFDWRNGWVKSFDSNRLNDPQNDDYTPTSLVSGRHISVSPKAEPDDVGSMALSLVDDDVMGNKKQHVLIHTAPRGLIELSEALTGSAPNVLDAVADVFDATTPESLSVLPVAVDSCCVLCRETTWDHVTNNISKGDVVGVRKEMNPDLKYLHCQGCGEKVCNLCVLMFRKNIKKLKLLPDNNCWMMKTSEFLESSTTVMPIMPEISHYCQYRSIVEAKDLRARKKGSCLTKRKRAR